MQFIFVIFKNSLPRQGLLTSHRCNAPEPFLLASDTWKCRRLRYLNFRPSFLFLLLLGQWFLLLFPFIITTLPGILVQHSSSPPHHMPAKSSSLKLVCHSLVDELFALPRLGYDGLQHAVSQGDNQVLALTCLIMWNVTVLVLLHWCYC